MKELNVDEQISPEFLKISLQGEYPEDLALDRQRRQRFVSERSRLQRTQQAY